MKDISKLFFGCFLPFVPFSVKMIPRCFNNVEVWSLGRIHPSIRPVATDFQSTSCVIWYNSDFSPSFPSLRMASWQPPFHGDHSDEASVNSRWINWMSRCISQILCHVFAFFKDIFIRYHSSAIDSFVVLPLLLLSSFLKFLTIDWTPCWFFS